VGQVLEGGGELIERRAVQQAAHRLNSRTHGGGQPTPLLDGAPA